MIGEIGLEALRRRRERTVAARLVFAELVANVVAIEAQRVFGVKTERDLPRRGAWEAYGPAILSGGDFDRLAAIQMAYSAVESAIWLIDNASPPDAKLLDRLKNEATLGLREVALLAGLSDEELDERLDHVGRVAGES